MTSIVNIDPVLYIGISQSLFAGLLIATKKPLTTANRIMAAWLFMFGIEMIFALLNSNVIEMYSFPFITFTYGPLLFLYVRFMTDPGGKFKWFKLLHFIPFIAFFTISVIFRSEPLVRDLRSFFKPDKLISLRIVYAVSFFLSISVYSTLAFMLIRKHQRNLMNLVSYKSGKITLNWLKIILISFYTACFILFLLGGLKMIGNFIPFDPYFVIFGFITLFSVAYSFYGIKQPVIFGEVVRSEENEKKVQGRYIKSGLKSQQADKYLQKLISYMETKKPYINSDLTIHDVSRQTGIPRHYITEVLNENYNRNFFTFINEYRVKEAISRMSHPEFRNYTILAIAFDSGFNSKSTFNTFFKNFTGKTPSDYRAEIDSRDG